MGDATKTSEPFVCENHTNDAVDTLDDSTKRKDRPRESGAMLLTPIARFYVTIVRPSRVGSECPAAFVAMIVTV